ncbi:hypothetical protein VE03_08280 [Pseudogymnoascus sp. 23342-1-I1]|nr:hypothetical protein VE03_08280 [Pseudogymnoascus sp. 23342-1-I1]
MDCIDAVNPWSEAGRRPTFLKRNANIATSGMGSRVSRQESSQNPKRPAGQENPRPSKRQRIRIDDLGLAKKLGECKLARKNHSPTEGLEEPSSLSITFSGILDKYGDKHESLIPRRLDGVAVRTRCSVQIYHLTSECQNGILTDVHEELICVSQEGDIRTSWNPATGHPETEINLPRPFVIPIRELYVPNPPAAKSGGASVQSSGEISDSEDDSDELLDQGEYGLAEKYFCDVSFSTVRMRPWPPLGLGSEIFQSSPIGKQLRHGHSNKRDLKLASKTELLPLESLSSMKVPLEIKLGPDRQTTQYQLALDAKWETPGITQPGTEKLGTPSMPKCAWKIALAGQAPSESKIGDCSCGICLAKLSSIKALDLHLRANHGQFEFTLESSTIDKQEFVVTVRDRASALGNIADVHDRASALGSVADVRDKASEIPPINTQITSNSPVSICSPVPVNISPLVDINLLANITSSADMDLQASNEPEEEIMRSIFDFEDDLSSIPSIVGTNPLPTPEPPCAEDFPNHGQLPARDPSTSASLSEPQSKESSLNTTPDAGSESDVPVEPRKRTRVVNSRRTTVHEGNDEDSSFSSLEDATPKLVVPKTAKPLFDIAMRRVLKPGEPLPPSTVSHDWRIRKQADLINSISDITPAEKEFMTRWDPFVFCQKSTSKIFMPAILKEFIGINSQWFDDKQCRKEELLKHLMNLFRSGRIEQKCLKECLEMFQPKRASPPKARQARKSPTIAREERSLLELWDSYVRDSKAKSLEKFLVAGETLRSGRSVHVSDGEPVAMLRLFLSYHKRTSGRDQLAIDGVFFNSKFPLPPTEAESEYVRFFNSFEANFKAPDGTEYLEQLMFSFFGDSTAWFWEAAQRFQWARKHLQELHWTKKIAPKFRQKLVTFLETMEHAHGSDEDMPDATTVDDLFSVLYTDLRNREKGKEAATPATHTFLPPLINPDLLNTPKPRKVRALCMCECGGYARPGESVTCSAELCIARTFHRACVPNVPPPGEAWYCRDCVAAELGQVIDTWMDRMNLST